MRNKALVLGALLVLSGCNEVPREKPGSSAPQASPVHYLHKNAIYLPDGFGLEFSGWLRNYSLISNEKGNFDRYIFEFPDELMAIEGALYAVISKQGYVRRISKEQPGLFVVDYVKKGFSPISMSYEALQPSADSRARTRLRVSWKNA